MTSLSDLPDQTLNEMCCKALGWKWVQQRFSQWPDGEPKLERGWDLPDGTHLSQPNPANPNFCDNLNLVQQYLVPHLKELQKLETFSMVLCSIILKEPFEDYEKYLAVEWDLLKDMVTAPARVRVVAFLAAVGTEVPL